MIAELDDIIDHMERYRGVTSASLDIATAEQLTWRPTPDQYSLGQHLLHIAQTEDFYSKGLFEDDWNYERVRFPVELPSKTVMAGLFDMVRARTLAHLRMLKHDQLGEIVVIPGSDMRLSLRSWLWFLIEHEMHHKAQVAVYLRLLGQVPPFYAMALPDGGRPDILVRQDLGGF